MKRFAAIRAPPFGRVCDMGPNLPKMLKELCSLCPVYSASCRKMQKKMLLGRPGENSVMNQRDVVRNRKGRSKGELTQRPGGVDADLTRDTLPWDDSLFYYPLVQPITNIASMTSVVD